MFYPSRHAQISSVISLSAHHHNKTNNSLSDWSIFARVHLADSLYDVEKLLIRFRITSEISAFIQLCFKTHHRPVRTVYTRFTRSGNIPFSRHFSGWRFAPNSASRRDVGEVRSRLEKMQIGLIHINLIFLQTRGTRAGFIQSKHVPGTRTRRLRERHRFLWAVVDSHERYSFRVYVSRWFDTCSRASFVPRQQKRNAAATL